MLLEVCSKWPVTHDEELHVGDFGNRIDGQVQPLLF